MQRPLRSAPWTTARSCSVPTGSPPARSSTSPATAAGRARRRTPAPPSTRGAAVVERLVHQVEPVYGVSTGFGALANTVIPAERSAELQTALVRSHAAGMGAEIEREVVRAMILLRARSLAMGFSGARAVVVDTMLALLNADVTPVVREHGSLGASGDLAPLASAALVLLGEGEARRSDGALVGGATALAEAGVAPLVLRAKEGLALINGTDGMLGMVVLALADLDVLLRVADIAGAMSTEALLGTDRAFAEDLVAMRPQVGQAVSAANLRALLAGSAIVASHRHGDDRVQDAYSLRCTPQVHGRRATRSSTPVPSPTVSWSRSSTTRWCCPTVVSSRAATSTARPSPPSPTSWPSRSPTSAPSASVAPTGCSTRRGRTGCRRSWHRMPASTPG